MSTIYLNIGSNRDNRRALILQAIELIAARWRQARLRRSPWVESAPWGYDSQNPFINIGLAIDLPPGPAPDPFAVLRAVKDIEQQIAPDDRHRNDDGSYRDRFIDIDIIAIDNMVVDTPTLTIPHPRAAARDFVMQPMQFLCPGWSPDTAKCSRKKTIADLDRDDVATYKSKPKIPLTLVLDNIRSLNNIGSMFRTSDAFAVKRICLCGITATPPSPEIHKTALGAEVSVEWTHYQTTAQAVAALRDEGCVITCLEQVKGSTMLQNFIPDPDKQYVLIVGNEVAGVDPAIVEQCDMYLEIPQVGTKHSLNVAVSTSIAIWHFFTNMKPETDA